MKDTITIPEAVERFNISRRAIYYWMRLGYLPFTVQNRSRRVQTADVAAIAHRSRKTFALAGL